MALSDILDQIEKETAGKMEQLKKDFADKKKTLEQKSKDKQKGIDEDIHQKVDEKSKKILEKAELLAEMEGKNKVLGLKRKLIEEAFDKAVEELVSSPKYVDLLAAMLKKAEVEGEATIIPAKGKESETKKAIEQSGKNYKLADNSANIKGGFILQSEKIEIDNSFETIVKNQLRGELEIQLNKLLFE